MFNVHYKRFLIIIFLMLVLSFLFICTTASSKELNCAKQGLELVQDYVRDSGNYQVAHKIEVAKFYRKAQVNQNQEYLGIFPLISSGWRPGTPYYKCLVAIFNTPNACEELKISIIDELNPCL
jgi:hypothetical protein